MVYKIEFIRSFNRAIPLRNVRLDHINTYSVLTEFFGSRSPPEPLTLPEATMANARAIVRQAKESGTLRFSEWLRNLRNLSHDSTHNILIVTTNATNFESDVALRTLRNTLPQDQLKPVVNQIAPVSVGCLLITKEDVICVGRRANVRNEGAYETFPSGYSNLDKHGSIFETLQIEAQEEARMDISQTDTSIELIGIVRNMVTPQFVHVIHSDLTLDAVRKNVNLLEHDLIYPLEVDPEKIKTYIENACHMTANADGQAYKLTDNTMAALLQFGSLRFGKSWYEKAIELTGENNPSLIINSISDF
jgi:hypothetical protein